MAAMDLQRWGGGERRGVSLSYIETHIPQEKFFVLALLIAVSL